MGAVGGRLEGARGDSLDWHEYRCQGSQVRSYIASALATFKHLRKYFSPWSERSALGCRRASATSSGHEDVQDLPAYAISHLYHGDTLNGAVPPYTFFNMIFLLKSEFHQALVDAKAPLRVRGF